MILISSIREYPYSKYPAQKGMGWTNGLSGYPDSWKGTVDFTASSTAADPVMPT